MTTDTANPTPTTTVTISLTPTATPTSTRVGTVTADDVATADHIDAFLGLSKRSTNSDLLVDVPMPGRITVVYDSTCELCRHARSWLETQRTYIRLDFLSANEARKDPRFAGVPWLGEELVVVADDGRVWFGPGAFITAMWTTRRYRSWAYRLSGDTFSVMARYFFHTITTERGRISGMLKGHNCDGDQCLVAERTVDEREPETIDQPVSAAIPKWTEARAGWPG